MTICIEMQLHKPCIPQEEELVITYLSESLTQLLSFYDVTLLSIGVSSLANEQLMFIQDRNDIIIPGPDAHSVPE